MSSQGLRMIVIVLLFVVVVLSALLFQKSLPANSVVIPDEAGARPSDQNNVSVSDDEFEDTEDVEDEEDHFHDENGLHIGESLADEGEVKSGGVEYEYSNAKVWTDGEYRYITSNGIPDHETGEFPNAGNPNSISEQELAYRVALNPVYIGHQVRAQLPGVALNGIPMEPGTAEREGNYNIEALQETYNLGLDSNNAHVQPNGLYHYHGVPELFLDSLKEDSNGLLHVGYAADGFFMYHDHSGSYVSGYELKSERDDGGMPDGTYTQDFEYVGQTIANKVLEQCGPDEFCIAPTVLDECNGAWMGPETYAYFLTDEFPYIPRCLNGEPDESFDKGPGANAQPQSVSAPTSQAPQVGGGNPPAEAITACSGKSVGSSCSISTPQGTLAGNCLTPPNQTQLACVPS